MAKTNAMDVMIWIAGATLLIVAWRAGTFDDVWSKVTGSGQAQATYNQGYMDGVVEQQANDAPYLVFGGAGNE
ncbi:MAG: hypothetical protein P4K78_10750 [Terracidiphilus sp.]|nr:hypothetical protein [Terracidiphilus sp.]